METGLEEAKTAFLSAKRHVWKKSACGRILCLKWMSGAAKIPSFPVGGFGGRPGMVL